MADPAPGRLRRSAIRRSACTWRNCPRRPPRTAAPRRWCASRRPRGWPTRWSRLHPEPHRPGDDPGAGRALRRRSAGRAAAVGPVAPAGLGDLGGGGRASSSRRRRSSPSPTSTIALDAALAGLGVAIMSWPLVADEIAEGAGALGFRAEAPSPCWPRRAPRAGAGRFGVAGGEGRDRRAAARQLPIAGPRTPPSCAEPDSSRPSLLDRPCAGWADSERAVERLGTVDQECGCARAMPRRELTAP